MVAQRAHAPAGIERQWRRHHRLSPLGPAARPHWCAGDGRGPPLARPEAHGQRGRQGSLSHALRWRHRGIRAPRRRHQVHRRDTRGECDCRANHDRQEVGGHREGRGPDDRSPAHGNAPRHSAVAQTRSHRHDRRPRGRERRAERDERERGRSFRGCGRGVEPCHRARHGGHQGRHAGARPQGAVAAIAGCDAYGIRPEDSGWRNAQRQRHGERRAARWLVRRR